MAAMKRTTIRGALFPGCAFYSLISLKCLPVRALEVSWPTSVARARGKGPAAVLEYIRRKMRALSTVYALRNQAEQESGLTSLRTNVPAPRARARNANSLCELHFILVKSTNQQIGSVRICYLE